MTDLRIVIVDDSDVYLETQALVLGMQDGIEVVATVQDSTTAAAVCAESGADVAVIDYRMPGADGAQVTRAVRAASAGTAVVCVAGWLTDAERDAVLEAGAAAVVEKGRPVSELTAAIRDAAGRET